MNAKLVFLSVAVLFFSFTAHAAEVINFGCPAYLIGGKPNLAALKQKGVTSIVMDPSAGISAEQAKAAGMQAIYYVNSFCQPDKFRCDGPRLAGSDVSGTYGEVIPQPDTQFFYNNFSSQTQVVQRLGGTIIEIDNMDEYVTRGHVNAIKYLIEAAGKSGINVLMKNETNATLIALTNVVGAIAEPGSHNKGYRAAFTRAGKPTAGVLVINGAAADAYTSVSNVNHTGESGEYTTFYNCTSNAGGVRIPAPPTDFKITPPPSLFTQNQLQPLLAPLQRPLTTLAQPLMQSPVVPQQTSPVQPLNYFSTPMSSVPSPVVSGENPPAPQPSVAESLLQMLRPAETVATPIIRPVVVLSTSTTSLRPTTALDSVPVASVSVAPAQPSTFVSGDLGNTAVKDKSTDVLTPILRKMVEVLSSVLAFLRVR